MASTKRPKKSRSLQSLFVPIIILAVALPLLGFLLLGGVITRPTSQTAEAWDCTLYNVSVGQNGDVIVRNASNRAEIATPIEVYINDTRVLPDLMAPALAPQTEAKIGTVTVPRTGFTWKTIVVKDRRCVDTGTHAPMACNIGYVFSRKAVSQGLGTAGYISLNRLKASAPVGATIKTFDLSAAGTITDVQAKGLQALVLADSASLASEKNIPVPVTEYPSQAEIEVISRAHTAGADIIAAGDNVSTRVGVDEGAALVSRVFNFMYATRYDAPSYQVRADKVPQIQTFAYFLGREPNSWGPVIPGIPEMMIDTTLSAETPGWLTVPVRRANMSCAYQLVTSRDGSTWDQPCLVLYIAPESGTKKGFFYVDANAGRPTNSPGVLQALLQKACQ